VSETDRRAAMIISPQASDCPLRLLLVDDHPVLRAGLKAMLSAETNLQVVAEADNGATAVELALELLPNIILMDVTLPRLNGAEATRQIKLARPGLSVIALSVHEELSFARMLHDAGASGYALKRSACDELVRAVRVVAAGGTYIDPSLAGHLMRATPGGRPAARLAAVNLSERETEVVKLLAEGLTMKEMAQQLSLSPRTLETYRARALEKLQLKTRAELVRFAIRNGWMSRC
jgi:DNA-binding NarL/FixJ family response regulator